MLAPGVGACSRGVWSQGVGLVLGVPAPGGYLLPVRVLAPLGVPGGDPPRTATTAGGTHPTGMHYCS